jgi:probable rRNA maturation factor
MMLTLLTPDTRWRAALPAFRAEVRKAVRLTLKETPAIRKEHAVGQMPALTIRFANDAEITALNAQFRGKEKPTNVLSFPDGEDGYLGDVILAYETIAHEAAAQGKSLRAHTLHLVVHGVLHLLGYDHAHPREARQMETLEIGILMHLGIANPYRAT